MSKDPIRAGEIVVFNVDVCGLNSTYLFYTYFVAFRPLLSGIALKKLLNEKDFFYSYLETSMSCYQSVV